MTEAMYQTESLDAPYGINPRTGNPYKKSPEERERLAAQLAAGRKAAARGTTGRASSGPRATPKSTGNAASLSYRDTVLTLLQVPAFGLSVAGKLSGNPLLMLDATAVTVHSGPVADAVASIAMDDTRVAAVLERVGQVGPYGSLVMALMPMIMQIGANHGVIEPNPAVGVYGPADLMREAGIDIPDDAGPPPPPAQGHYIPDPLPAE